ncbi:serine/threonine-protein kinase phg2 isoform X2 [Stomoxys calcitrans]|uniref:Uncharacterized protein n=1 Tax=Stomoxys calcitrans TaxID=35570 RepID=A0A1I8Q0A9_STOCA|nr:serine/threonine-protein kinase phg2 isoform X2 [Stomoxys calcitrans]
MLVATPGQTTVYTLHNNGNAPQSSSATVAASAASTSTKKPTSVNISSSSSGTPKCLTNNNSKTNSFITNLKESVQKALVTTASSFSRNCQQGTTSAIKCNSNSNYNNTSTTKSIFSSYNATSSSTSSSSVATNKYSSTAIANTSSSLSSISSAILPLTVARKKCSQGLSMPPKLHTVPPTILHRDPEERQQASSTDSLQKEMCHFKPIRTVPTTPWKSGSKSRGSSLRFPKANLATTKLEFILKLNCDVNNRMKKKTTSRLERKELEAEESGLVVDHIDEQENKEYYERYKPKPSTLHLFAHSETPNHQSAFVCLVAHMKNLINIQSVKMLTTGSLELHRTKSSRNVRTKDKGNDNSLQMTDTSCSNLRKNIDEIFVRPKKFKSPTAPMAANKKMDLITTGSRSIGSKTLETNDRATKKISQINELSLQVTKAKSRRKLKGAKSNITHPIKESQMLPTVDAGHTAAAAEMEATATAGGRRPNRKRASTPEIGKGKSMTVAASTSKLRATKRLAGQQNESNLSGANQQRIGSFSPPLTRSRLKQMMQQQQMPKEELLTPDKKKRKV